MKTWNVLLQNVTSNFRRNPPPPPPPNKNRFCVRTDKLRLRIKFSAEDQTLLANGTAPLKRLWSDLGTKKTPFCVVSAKNGLVIGTPASCSNGVILIIAPFDPVRFLRSLDSARRLLNHPVLWRFKNWFTLSVRIWSYGCTRKVWSAREKRGQSNSGFLSALQTSQVHP